MDYVFEISLFLLTLEVTTIVFSFIFKKFETPKFFKAGLCLVGITLIVCISTFSVGSRQDSRMLEFDDLCSRDGSTMKIIKEDDNEIVYKCPSCRTVHIVPKNKSLG